MRIILFISILSLLQACTQSDSITWTATAPAGNQYTQINRNGVTVIPNGRLLTPAGKQITVAPHPFGLAISHDGKTIITSNSGTAPFSISIIQNYNEDSARIRQIPEGMRGDEESIEKVFMGLAVSPDGSKVYVAGGQENLIYVFDIESGKKINGIDCAKTFDRSDYSDGYIGDLTISKDGSRLYAVDQIGFRMLTIDTKTNSVISNTPTGRYPFGIILSPDEKTVYVANVGMFEYSYVKSLDKERLKETSLPYPAFAYGSKEMKEGIKNDTLEVEGLGDMNADEAFSVWSFDVSKPQPTVTSKIKTGILVGEEVEGIETVGGSSPNSMAIANNFLFVSNGNNDNITVIDTKRDMIIDHINITLDKRLGNLKGIIPFGLAISPDQKRLYVAEAGINAVGVVDIDSRQMLGHIPTGWFPSKVQVTPDGKQLIVTNAKGFGSGPNGGSTFVRGKEGSYIGSLMKGTVSIIDVPSDDELKSLTEKAVNNNFKFVEADKMEKSPIKYIVFISKENRTYDEVFGQVKNGNGDSTLARFGRNRTFSNRKKTATVSNATVMPNHLALAEQFTLSDNFYVDSDVSADGHRWLAATYPNEWLETHHPASYGGGREFKDESNAPGKFGMTGASGAIYPEDYNQHGSLWDHLYRNKKEFYNFGFGVEFGPGSFSDSTMKYGGVRYLVNYPMPGPLYDRTSRLFPTYNTAIPDQFRADVFIQEVKEKYINKNIELPSLLTLQLLNDHGAGDRAHAGFPFYQSYMADNDLALGRVVEFLSHTKYWANMMIIVTEDDAQDGYDHVDAHRSLLMVISPYAKRNFNSHTHYSFGSIFKTFWKVLNVPCLNQYDFGATDLTDCMTDKPDFTPYTAIPSDTRIFDPAKALKPFQSGFDWEGLKEGPDLDDVNEIKKQRKKDEREKVNH